MKIETPFDLGQQVYKICPKCSEKHNGSCKYCAWGGCLSPCDIGVTVYSDGSYNELDLQLVPYIVSERSFFTIKKHWGIMFFETKAEAEKALKEYDEIRQTPDKQERIQKYNEWVNNRKLTV